jgi:soluble lytic murein transglycosylase-like protein
MITVNIKVPQVNEAFYKDSDLTYIKNTILNARKKYGSFIDELSNVLEIPKELIYAMIYIESAGKENEVSPANAYGLLQITKPTAEDIFALMRNQIQQNPKLKQLIIKLFPDKYTCLLSKAYAGQKECLTVDDLLNPYKNLLIGSLIIRYLLDKYRGRLDALVIAYNKVGLFQNVKIGNTPADTLNLEKTPETRNYIIKLLGRNSALGVAILLREQNQI